MTQAEINAINIMAMKLGIYIDSNMDLEKAPLFLLAQITDRLISVEETLKQILIGVKP